ncbi:hypothetical protein [Xanthomarina sp.]|uniref:hypothetical protein n=1 Tax=Xanthomarina sp. TaxID=1931211 RepID=UPI002B65BFFF|nr:hypothetical protein [Xanthomarina sp.]HLV38655.1 hypothetical protein [Xanthomarina sp.]
MSTLFHKIKKINGSSKQQISTKAKGLIFFLKEAGFLKKSASFASYLAEQFESCFYVRAFDN